MSGRKCVNCRHYEPSPIWRSGWCRNPRLYTPQESHLVAQDGLECAHRVGNYWEPIESAQDLTHFPTPPAAGVVSAHFVYSVLDHSWSPPPHPVGLAEPVALAAAVQEAAVARPARVRDPAAVGMILLAGPAGVTLVAEIPTLDESPEVRLAPPGDTPGRIGPFNPGVRRDRSGP